jgi:hypothetical protein
VAAAAVSAAPTASAARAAADSGLATSPEASP